MASKKTSKAAKAAEAETPAPSNKVVYDDGSYAEGGKYYLANGEYSGYDTLDDYFAMQEAMNGKGDSDAGNGTAESVLGGGELEPETAAAQDTGVDASGVHEAQEGVHAVVDGLPDVTGTGEGGHDPSRGGGKGEEAPAGTALGVTPLPAPDADLIAALGALYAQGNAIIEYLTNANALSDNDVAKLRHAQAGAYDAVLSCYGKLKENGK